MYGKILAAAVDLFLIYYFADRSLRFYKGTLFTEFLQGVDSGYFPVRSIAEILIGTGVVLLIFSEYFLADLTFILYVDSALLILIFAGIIFAAITNKKYLGRLFIKH